MNLDFIQIGAADGVHLDEVYPHVIAGEFITGILVEPNPECLILLRKNYEAYAGIIIEPIAIADYTGELKLYSDRNAIASHWSSFRREHLIAHGSNSMNVIETIYPCSTLIDLYNKYGVKSLRWLFIDTEGLDAQILMSTDFNEVRVENIMFEHIHTDGPLQKAQVYDDLLTRLEIFGFKKTGMSNWNTTLSRNL